MSTIFQPRVWPSPNYSVSAVSQPHESTRFALSAQPMAHTTPPTGKGTTPIGEKLDSSPPPVNWDEQLGLTISQSKGSLAYNVSAVEQSDSDGYGPAYLLNGLTNIGDWYQAGLAYDWPLAGGGYQPGFTFLYESFNSSGVSVFPANGGGGLLNYSGPINEGDQILLSLNFTGSEVVMFSEDWNTGATAWTNFTSDGGSIFVGLETSNNANGFFSGLMTEQYHALPYTGQEGAETYSNPYVGLSSATMWIDEYDPNTNVTLFTGSTADIPYSNPNLLLSFSTNGTSEASDAYEFITGSNFLVPVTVSYGIVGGGSAYSAPILNYVSDGAPENVTLTPSPTLYLMDQGSSWQVTNPLNGSSSSERWITPEPNGTVTTATTLIILYTHEFQVGFGSTPEGGGSVSPSVAGWYDAGIPLNLTATPHSPFLFSGWFSNSSDIEFTNFTSPITTALIYSPGNITGQFSVLALSLSNYSASLTGGSSISDVAKVMGINQSVTMSVSGLPEGGSVSWENNELATFSLEQVVDDFNISTSFSSPSGIYNITITATSANTSESIIFTLDVGQADPLTVSYSVNDDSAAAIPTMTYVFNGEEEQISLSQAPEIVYVDNGSTWQISSLLNGSTAQRWIASSSTQGIASGADTIQIVYYHEFLVGFTFGSLANTTSTASAGFPTVTFTSEGIATSVQANGSQVWADSGSTYSYSPVIPVSSTTRWLLAQNQSGSEISESTTLNALYLEQYLVNASYAIEYQAQSGLLASPKLIVGGNGSSITIPLSEGGADYWIDSESTWSASANLSGTSGLERWYGTGTSGIVTSQAAIRPSYNPQFFLTISQNAAAAGSVSGQNGWYDLNSTVPITATANQGWQFEMWTGGAGTFNQSSVRIKVNGPLNETAVFYSSLSLTAGPGGHISYSFGSNSGTVSGGSNSTLYVPPGTNVSLTASSDSSFYSPATLSVTNETSSPSSSLVISVSAPTSVSVSFDLDITLIALIVAVIAGIAGSMLFIFLRRSGGREYSNSTSHTWKW